MGNNNQNRGRVKFLDDISNEGDNLNSFPLAEMGQQLRLKTSWAYQSHLIRENTRLVIPPVVAKPVKTLNLQKFSVSGQMGAVRGRPILPGRA